MNQTANEFTTTIEHRASLNYLLYLPDDHERRKDWPLIVFLHGSGERGNDVSLVRDQGLPRLLDEGLKLPAIVVSPQCPSGQLWTRQLPAVKALIDELVSRFGVDTSRIVATGLSLGGAGACELVSFYPETFAALAPICGPWTRLFVTAETAKIDTWVFHGDADTVVPIEESQMLVDEIRALGGSPRFTVYPGVGHNSWDPAYADEELLAWLVLNRTRS